MTWHQNKHDDIISLYNCLLFSCWLLPPHFPNQIFIPFFFSWNTELARFSELRPCFNQLPGLLPPPPKTSFQGISGCCSGTWCPAPAEALPSFPVLLPVPIPHSESSSLAILTPLHRLMQGPCLPALRATALRPQPEACLQSPGLESLKAHAAWVFLTSVPHSFQHPRWLHSPVVQAMGIHWGALLFSYCSSEWDSSTWHRELPGLPQELPSRQREREIQNQV